jgi:hypothetical protein
MQGEDLTRRIWIDVAPLDGEPHVGQFIVAVGKRKPGAAVFGIAARANSVYMIISWRRIKRRDPNAGPRFALVVQRGYTYDDAHGTDYWTMRWNSRNKK